jgi:hypothetical protein
MQVIFLSVLFCYLTFYRWWILLTFCADVGADILDLTGQNTESFGHLAEEDTHFELSPAQKEYFNVAQRINSYLRQEYHTLYEFLWNTGYNPQKSALPPR